MKPIVKTKFVQVFLLVSLITSLFAACIKKSDVFASNTIINRSNDQADRSEQSDGQTNQLEKMLAEANWQAIAEAGRLGKAALPIVRRYLNDKNYQVRQIAVGCAGAIGDQEGADILIGGLKDSNINVRLAAAKELAKKGYPSALDTLLEVLKESPDETVREFLATGAGYLPGEKTIAVLRPIAKDNSVLADKAIFALAKLGDPAGRKALALKLAAVLPRTRYEALESLCYINDARFVPPARNALSDKAAALRIGSVRNPQNRRVCDQAVDSLVCLLKLQPPFPTSVEKIYSDQEIKTLRNLLN